MFPKKFGSGTKAKTRQPRCAGSLSLFAALAERETSTEGIELINNPKEGLLAKIQSGSPDVPEAYEFEMMRVIFQTFLDADKTDDAVKLVGLLEKKKRDKTKSKKTAQSISDRNRQRH